MKISGCSKAAKILMEAPNQKSVDRVTFSQAVISALRLFKLRPNQLQCVIAKQKVCWRIRVKGVVYRSILGESPVFGMALAIRLNEKPDVVRNFYRLATACYES